MTRRIRMPTMKSSSSRGGERGEEWNVGSGFADILGHVVPFTLVMFRLLGLFVSAPMLSSVVVPARAKVLLALMLSAAIYPSVPVTLAADFAPQGDFDLFMLLPMIVIEGLLGFSVGVIASMPLMALEMSGVMMGQQMGLGLARVYNPEADYEADVIGQLLFYIASGIFFAVGGADHLWRAVADSFATVPIAGLKVMHTPLDLLLGVLSASFDLALRVATPVTGIILLLVVVFGAIGKTMPQINIMSVGFTIKIMMGIGIVAASVYAIQEACSGTITEAIGRVTEWVRVGG